MTNKKDLSYEDLEKVSGGNYIPDDIKNNFGVLVSKYGVEEGQCYYFLWHDQQAPSNKHRISYGLTLRSYEASSSCNTTRRTFDVKVEFGYRAGQQIKVDGDTSYVYEYSDYTREQIEGFDL